MLLRLKSYLLVLVFAFIGMVHADSFRPLPVDQVMPLSVSFIRPAVVQAEWQIASGYNIYVDSVKFKFMPTVAVEARYPNGQWRLDPEGRHQMYAGSILIPITLPATSKQLTMVVEYQGCSQRGYCYPPMSKGFALDLEAMTVTPLGDMQNTEDSTPSLTELLTSQDGAAALLRDHHFGVMLLIFVGLGLLLAFTPCVLPMIPILTSIILGQKQVPGKHKAFFLSLTYVMGMSMTYAGAGMVAASLGSSIQVWLQKPVTIAIVSGLFVLLALSLFGLYELRFSKRWHNWIYAWSNKHEGGTYFGVFVMGVLATLVVSPCVTAPLVGVLIYIGQSGNLVLGASALFAMGIGMGIPLLLIGVSAGRWLPKSGAWMKAVKEMFGIFMVAMAIWLLSRIVSPAVTKLLFGLLLLAAAGFVGLYLPRLIRFRKINRMIGLATAFFGLFLLLASINMMITTQPQPVLASPFTIAHTLEDVETQLALAKAANKPVLLDFYADWCESCVTMDRQVFTLPSFQLALRDFVLLRVDLSSNTSADGDILKHFDVIAPPTILFFNKLGQEVNARRIVGELDASTFMNRVSSFITASCDKKVEC